MPKLAIYVPKQEMKKIDRWRKKINFSRVFMQALSREIERKSRDLAVDGDRVAAAAAFYGNKLANDLGPVRKFGSELGSEDVIECRLSATDIQRIVAAPSDQTEQGWQVVETATQRHMRRIKKFAEQQKMGDLTNPGWRSHVFEGYVEGVRATWEEVCAVMNRPHGRSKKK